MTGLIATALYGLLSIVGGVFGYLKSKSQISLISGVISGLLLLIMAVAIYFGKTWATPFAAIIIGLLVIVFIIRWLKTKKPIPAIPMISLGIVAIVLILI